MPSNVLDWLQQYLGGGQSQAPSDPLAQLLARATGDPEAQASAAASQAMEPVVGPYLNRVASGAMTGESLRESLQSVNDAFANQDYPGLAGMFSGGGLAAKLPRAAASARFPQYAEAYPETGPPTMKTDPKTGKIFPEKTLTPEAEAFRAERLNIMKDMAKNGYEPYFDPAQRYYADPSQYPPANVDTATLGPSKQATIEKYMTAIGAPETSAALRNAYAKGLDLGNAEHWYAVGQLEAKYIDELGPKEGREKFLDEFAAPMAATTSGNSPTFNLLMSHYLETMRKAGEPMPTAGYELPYPVGGRRAGVNLRDYAGMRDRGGYEGLGAGQPKMHDFSRSFLGDLSHPVMDEQMATGMLAHAPGLADPARTTAYGMLQKPLYAEAEASGVLPGNYQDVAWAGFKGEPGQPMISVINDAIERTHRLTGMPKEEIVRRGLVRKEIPLYGLLGAPVGAGAASGDY